MPQRRGGEEYGTDKTIDRFRRAAYLLKEYDRIIIDPLTSLLFEKELTEIQEMELKEIHSFFPQTLLAKPLYKDVLIDRIIGLNNQYFITLVD